MSEQHERRQDVVGGEPSRSGWWPAIALAVVTLLLVAACAGDDADQDATGASVDVNVADTSLGEVLVDGDGMTVYIFDADEAGASTCYGACAQAWPPLLVDGEPVAGGAVDDALLGTTTRDDGSQQVTYAGWPLYLWAGDGSPGDVAGQAVDDAWWVITARGDILRDESPTSTDAEDAPARDDYY